MLAPSVTLMVGRGCFFWRHPSPSNRDRNTIKLIWGLLQTPSSSPTMLPITIPAMAPFGSPALLSGLFSGMLSPVATVVSTTFWTAVLSLLNLADGFEIVTVDEISEAADVITVFCRLVLLTVVADCVVLTVGIKGGLTAERGDNIWIIKPVDILRVDQTPASRLGSAV
ncbi:hypothetical protein BKA66DRAFT_448229 [Pyrenochaeta sp. MPI-SDFR-AT-0127]|nr:hypothetical protein BKA66DRAFT_448229 [Pyrenochaeta sp. MPI-SDFR-AT-0127]